MPQAHGWKLLTLADDPTFTDPPETLVRCVCGRRRPAEMFVDLRPVNGRVVARGGRSSQFACDACRHTLRREGKMRDEDLFRAHGAPPMELARARARDAIRAAMLRRKGKAPDPPGFGAP